MPKNYYKGLSDPCISHKGHCKHIHTSSESLSKNIAKSLYVLLCGGLFTVSCAFFATCNTIFLLFLKTLVQSNKIWYMYTYVTWGSREDEGSQGCPNAPPPPSGKIKYIRFSYLLSPNLGSVTLYNSALEIHPLIWALNRIKIVHNL